MARTARTKRINGVTLVVALAGSSVALAAKCDLKEGFSAQQGRAGLCKFDAHIKSFEGTPAQQAACLTREVKRLGNIGNETITPILKGIAGKPAISTQALQALLDAQHIKPTDVGGSLNKPISADYFIIHDTSTPNCSADGPSVSCPVRGEFELKPKFRRPPQTISQSFGTCVHQPHRCVHYRGRLCRRNCDDKIRIVCRCDREGKAFRRRREYPAKNWQP